MTPWEQVLKTARWAPSFYNSQPWKLELHSDVDATLYLDRGRVLASFDPEGHFAEASLGLFVEIVSIVATNEGWTLQEEFLPPMSDKDGLVPFARLTLKPGIHRRSLYSNELVLRRRTSRLEHAAEPLAPTATQRLSETAADWGQTLTWVLEPAAVRAVAEAHIDALCDDLLTPERHRDLARWFRCSMRQARLNRDGLDPKSLGVSGFRLWLLKKWPALIRPKLFRRWMRRSLEKRLGHVQTVGILSGPFQEREWAIKAGRFLARFWLEATRLDLRIHPFGHLIAHADGAETLKGQTGRDGAWFAFRIGHTKNPPECLRLREDELTLRPA